MSCLSATSMYLLDTQEILSSFVVQPTLGKIIPHVQLAGNNDKASIAYTTSSPLICSCRMLLSCTKRASRVFRPSSSTFLMDSKSFCAMEMVPPLRGVRRKRILTPDNKNFSFSTKSRSDPSSWRRWWGWSFLVFFMETNG